MITRVSRTIAVLLSVGALCALAACGSSSGGSSSSATSATKSTSSGASLKIATTPKYLNPSPSEHVRSGLVNVAYHEITIHPALLRVKVGTTIKWTNYDEVIHTVTSRSGPQQFASGNLSPHATFQVTLTRPGLIHYLCTIHPATMNGTIQVVP